MGNISDINRIMEDYSLKHRSSSITITKPKQHKKAFLYKWMLKMDV